MSPAATRSTKKSARHRRKSAIPVGTQFNPNLVALPNFLAAVIANSGDKTAIERAIWKPSVRVKLKSSGPTTRNSSLPVEAAVKYGLLDNGYNATPLATKLALLSGPALYEEFARHILLNLGGLRVIEATLQMEADNIAITGDSLAQFLSDQGFTVVVHNTAINSLRLWLAQTGIFPLTGRDKWKCDLIRREEILPLSQSQISILAGLKPHVHAFVRALCRADPSGPVLASTIRDAAEGKEGIRMGRVSLPNDVLNPLQKAGIITFTTGGTAGGKSAVLETTPLFDKEILEPFVTNSVKDLDAAVSDYYKRRPADIFADLTSTDTFRKGQALEALAIFLMRQLGLRFLHWNKRALASTAQAEVDVVLAGLIGAIQTRWQVQCKNKPTTNVDVGDVAKEVGLIPVTQATHILMVSTGGFTGDAVKYAREIMRRTPITIFMLGHRDLDAIKQNPAVLLTILRLQSEVISRLQPVSSVFSV